MSVTNWVKELKVLPELDDVSLVLLRITVALEVWCRIFNNIKYKAGIS